MNNLIVKARTQSLRGKGIIHIALREIGIVKKYIEAHGGKVDVIESAVTH